MRINKIDFTRFRNDEHFQFHTEFQDLVVATGAETLKIATQFDTYQALKERVDEALKKIMRSAVTDQIQAADHRRDNTYRGLVYIVRAYRNFRPDEAEAARKLEIVFNTYGWLNLVQRPLNEQTSAIYNLLQELNGTYADDIHTINAGEWVKELEASNNTFEELVKARYDETAHRTDIVLREARLELDVAYRTIIERIEALVIVEGLENYDAFIRRLNVVITKYNNNLAQRQGRRSHSPSPSPSPLNPPKGDLA
jgi:hypothetical protein